MNDQCPECGAYESHYMHCSENPLTFSDEVEQVVPADSGQTQSGARPEGVQGGDQTGENHDYADMQLREELQRLRQQLTREATRHIELHDKFQQLLSDKERLKNLVVALVFWLQGSLN